ncbi:hypothetical protein NDU88_006847 [Pleurodeles waltl]|uniref:Uncharacterized protein n=1 Tax=Pleurodeles waltl TaxID=8319 RepID=A0AAV7RRA7_PLEWA|nr:hypothetical protein NDU88_006847 [Pleurodeles waltl]
MASTSPDRKVQEALRLLAEAGRLALVVGSSSVRPVWCATSGMAAVIVCSPPHIKRSASAEAQVVESADQIAKTSLDRWARNGVNSAT